MTEVAKWEVTKWGSREAHETVTTYNDTTLSKRLDKVIHNSTFADKAILTTGFISELNRLYEFRGDGVVRYLANYPSLFNLLKEAHEQIRKYFGQDVRVALDAIKDGEMDDSERLFAFVQTELSADDALDRLYELYEQWWLDALSGVQPKMSIDVEFV